MDVELQVTLGGNLHDSHRESNCQRGNDAKETGTHLIVPCATGIFVSKVSFEDEPEA
jgi:hypothetical protein